MFATQHVNKDALGRKSKEDLTGILLTMIRLEKQKTDIVIAVNVPHIPGDYKKDEIDLPAQKVGKHIEDATAIRQRILDTFEIKDWNLFVHEEDEDKE